MTREEALLIALGATSTTLVLVTLGWLIVRIFLA